MTSKIAELVLRCFHARTNAHILHLQTGSYAAHKALNEFYDGIVELVDSLAEAYQGDYGLIEFPMKSMSVAMNTDGLSLMNALSTWIVENRKEVCDADDTYLQNIIDEILALIRSTQYKLKFLK